MCVSSLLITVIFYFPFARDSMKSVSCSGSLTTDGSVKLILCDLNLSPVNYHPPFFELAII